QGHSLAGPVSLATSCGGPAPGRVLWRLWGLVLRIASPWASAPQRALARLRGGPDSSHAAPAWPTGDPSLSSGSGCGRTQELMSGDVCVHAWPGSYYWELQKRWVPGRLTLTPRALSFMAEGAGDALVSIPLASIAEVKKAASSFIFSCITVREWGGGAKHWFGALQPSRDATFHVLEHFWRERLLCPAGAPATRGQALVGLLAGAQQHLEDAARALHHQGRQIDGVARSLGQMEADLDVADSAKGLTPCVATRLLTELEGPAWWPFGRRLWKTPADTRPPARAPTASAEARTVLGVPAVIWRGAEAQPRPGRLTVLASGLEVHGPASTLLHRFARDDVDSIQVHTPYEVTVHQRCLGKPYVAFRLLSARMPEAIRALGLQFSQKMELLGDAAQLGGPSTASPGEWAFSVFQAASGPHDPAARASPEGGQLQLQSGGPPVSEGDAQQLRQILTQLKDLALGAEAELERQDEALDGIATATDRATLAIDRHTRRMRRLT
ncbi:Synaptosomal-associated protein 47, partial [Galemys pyrenaicus]